MLRPLAEYFKKHVLDSGGLGCDDTHVTLITPRVVPTFDETCSPQRAERMREVLQAAIDRREPSVTARFWAYRSFEVPLNVFDFTVSRHRDGPDDVLRNYRGNLLADAYSGFDGVVLDSDERIRRFACWSHARRKFVDLRSNHPQLSAQVLAMIRELYDIEHRGRGLSAVERQLLRERESQPVLARLTNFLDSPPIRDALPKSDLAKAANYLRNQGPELTAFLHDGRVPIDNNDVEQLMKQVATGRKNWLFVGSVAGGERSATLMTIVSSALRSSLDVSMYLKDILDRLLAGETNYEPLLPQDWAQSHPTAIRRYRLDERRTAADRLQTRRSPPTSQ